MSTEFPKKVDGPFGKMDAGALRHPAPPVDPSTLEAAADTLEGFYRDSLGFDEKEAAKKRSQMLHPAFSALAPAVVKHARMVQEIRGEVKQHLEQSTSNPDTMAREFKAGVEQKKQWLRSGDMRIDPVTGAIRPRRQMRPYHGKR